jgi:hypothetical protein
MKKYFVEFEFKSTFDKTYWLPLFIEVDTDEEAKEIYQRLLTGLEQHYQVKRSSEPKLYVTGINSEFIDDYINHRMTGKIEALDVTQWKIKDVEATPDINFDEALSMIDLEKAINEKEVASCISRQKLPIRVIHKNTNLDDVEEFLLINVVAPTFINKLIGAFKNRKV